MTSPIHDAFGRLVADPATLSQRELIDVLRRWSGRQQASTRIDDAWIGRKFGEWLHGGGSLERALGLTPRRGSHARPDRLIRDAETRGLLRLLASQVGNNARCARILAGVEPTPRAVAELVQELRARRAPCSLRSIARARSVPR